MDNCIFCKIVNGQIPSFKIFEDKNYLAFFDISQFVPGHTLVIPKKHYPTIWEVPEIGEYFAVIQKIGNHYKNNLGYKYADTMSFGRLVPHAHFHILPHNGENKEYLDALAKIDAFTRDKLRRLTPEKGFKLAQKMRLA